MANFDNIKSIAHADLQFSDALSWHSDESFFKLNGAWHTIETVSHANGWDVFAAVRTDTGLVRHAIRSLRAVLLRVLPEEQRRLRSGAYEANFLEGRQATYGDSWKRRGGVGAFMMLARKWDRIENMTGDDIKLRKAVETNTGDIIDDIDDLRRYLLLVEDECI